mmetsp:Transcript_16114/g.41369  ORF Transcript_16114/g.41369 Transcript_16114/m.41369 type:complete len:255 (-) Transcript_16114:30-794(-)
MSQNASYGSYGSFGRSSASSAGNESSDYGDEYNYDVHRPISQEDYLGEEPSRSSSSNRAAHASGGSYTGRGRGQSERDQSGETLFGTNTILATNSAEDVLQPSSSTNSLVSTLPPSSNVEDEEHVLLRGLDGRYCSRDHLNYRERRWRVISGILVLAATSVLGVAIMLAVSSRWWRTLLFIGYVGSGLFLIQAQQKVCISLAFSKGNADHLSEEALWDQIRWQSARRRVALVFGFSFGFGLVLTLIWLALPEIG